MSISLCRGDCIVQGGAGTIWYAWMLHNHDDVQIAHEILWYNQVVHDYRLQWPAGQENTLASGPGSRLPTRLYLTMNSQIKFHETVELLKNAIYAACDGQNIPTLFPHDVLYKIAECRSFDMQSAAQRYLWFINVCEDYLWSLEESPEKTKGLNIKIFHFGRFNLSRRLRLIRIFRNLYWPKKISPKDR